MAEKSMPVIIVKNRRMPKTAGFGLSVLPGMVFGELIIGHLQVQMTTSKRILMLAVFTALYVILSIRPYICVIAAIANMVLYTGLMWVIADRQSILWIAWTVKVITAGIIILPEMCICTNVMSNIKSKKKY